jgi:hypothetical protein
MSKKYNVKTRTVAATPRRSRGSGSTGGGGGVTVVTTSSSSSNDTTYVGHSHENLNDLNKITEADGYLYDNGEKVKAGYADEAAHADAATKADTAEYADEAGKLSNESAFIETLRDYFLSKTADDIAQGLITFLQGLKLGSTNYGLDADGNAILKGITAEGITTDKIDAANAAIMAFILKKGGSIRSNEYDADIVSGKGFSIDSDGNLVIDSAIIRRSLTVPLLSYNRVDIKVGNEWQAPGGGIIETVTPDSDGAATGTITLRLEDGEIGAVAVDDICMGIFHSLTTSLNSTENYDDGAGNQRFAGFYTCYFRVTEILETANNSKFRYALRPVSDNYPVQYQPAEQMQFVSYGNFSDTERQKSSYRTRTYDRYLVNVSSWEYTTANVASQRGDMSNLVVNGKQLKGNSTYTNSIYFNGSIEFLTPEVPYELTIDTNGDSFMAWGEHLSMKCKVKRGWKDVTDRVTSWKIERDSGDSTNDAAWALRSKVKAFDGSYDFYYGDTTADGEESDLPLNNDNLSIIFTITATIDDETVSTILEI